MKKLLFITILVFLNTQSQFAQYLNPMFIDSYTGTRLSPLEEYDGFVVNKTFNRNIGFRAVNSDDVGNGAIASFTAAGSGSLYSNGTTLTHFGANYFVPFMRGNGALYSSKKLIISNSGDNDIDFMTGTTFSGMTAKLIIKTNGQIKLPVSPDLDYSSEFLSRLPDGKIIRVINTSINNTTIPLTLIELNTQYPNAVIGFRVQCISIIAGALIYEKTGTGWISTNINVIN